MPQFVSKLRRLADSLEHQEPFVIQITGERIHVPARAVCNVEHEIEGKTEDIELQIKWASPWPSGGAVAADEDERGR